MNFELSRFFYVARTYVKVKLTSPNRLVELTYFFQKNRRDGLTNEGVGVDVNKLLNAVLLVKEGRRPNTKRNARTFVLGVDGESIFLKCVPATQSPDLLDAEKVNFDGVDFSFKSIQDYGLTLLG